MSKNVYKRLKQHITGGKKINKIKANTNIEKKILTGIEIILIRTANWECSTDNVPPLRRKLLPTRERGKLVPVCV